MIFESDVPGAKLDVLSISNAKIDVPDVRTVSNHNTKMEIGSETAKWFTWHNFDESQ